MVFLFCNVPIETLRVIAASQLDTLMEHFACRAPRANAANDLSPFLTRTLAITAKLRHLSAQFVANRYK